MKTDLLTSIVAAIAGVLIAYFVTNMFIGPIEEVTYKTVETKVDTDVQNPNPEVFNYRALNPTVEVYVGECEEYNQFGECIEVVENEEIEEIEEVVTPNSETNNQETN